jgi:DNA-binding MarR family transcriptional regulator
VSSARVRDGRKRDWFWLDDAVVDRLARDMQPLALAVYVVLARHADGEGRCWPSRATIAEKLGVSRGTVRNAIKHLAGCGLIDVEIRRNDDGSHRSNVYTLLDVGAGDLAVPPKADEDQGEGRGGGQPADGGGLSDPNPTQEKETPPGGDDPGGSSPETRPTPSAVDVHKDLSAEEYEALPVEKKQQHLIGYLHKRLRERELLGGRPLTKAYKDRLSGELGAEIRAGTRRPRLLLALDHIVQRWPERRQPLHEAMDDTEERRGGLRVLPGGRNAASPTPESAVEALRRHERYGRYADVALEYDFTQEAEPPFRVLSRLGGDDEERRRNLKSIRSVCRRAVREAASPEPREQRGSA